MVLLCRIADIPTIEQEGYNAAAYWRSIQRENTGRVGFMRKIPSKTT
jgi:hypothetical protein